MNSLCFVLLLEYFILYKTTTFAVVLAVVFYLHSISVRMKLCIQYIFEVNEEANFLGCRTTHLASKNMKLAEIKWGETLISLYLL
jgi:hypothetical protein